MYTSYYSFLDDLIPALANGNPALHVLFATNGGVNGYPKGQFSTARPALSMWIQTGSLHYEQVGRTNRNARLLSVIFCNRDELDAVSALAQDIRRNYEDGVTVILTSPNDKEKKRGRLESLLDTKAADMVVETPCCCPPAFVMARVLETILQVYPLPIATPAPR